MSAISAVFTIVFAERSTQWILADGLIFTRLVRSLVGEVISCPRVNLLKEDTCYADLGFPCPRPIITAAECFDELIIFFGLAGEPFEGVAFQVRVPANQYFLRFLC